MRCHPVRKTRKDRPDEADPPDSSFQRTKPTADFNIFVE